VTSAAGRPPAPPLATLLERPVLEVAPRLLGCVMSHRVGTGAGTATVAVRLVEVEAYDGANDPGSHAYRGRTRRNAVMFGAPGTAYVYFTYGMHWCMNVVCAEAGRSAAVLLRAGEVVEGAVVARARRGERVSDRDLARGPARLCAALGVDGSCNGAALLDPDGELRLVSGEPLAPEMVSSGPRVGLSAAATRPWRFWISGHPCVSSYRAHPSRQP
jgi:DNA-3-methyladenine glycosylase